MNIKCGCESEYDCNCSEIKICECSTLPSKKYYTNTQFSEVKTKTGKKSVPFLGLNVGTHAVKFQTEGESIIREVKVWYSMFGWAWQILKPCKKEKNYYEWA